MAEIKEILSTAQTKMQKTIEVLRVDLASVRAGRASVSLLDKVMVEYYGTPTPVNQVVQGNRRYPETVEADRLRHEEGKPEDI